MVDSAIVAEQSYDQDDLLQEVNKKVLEALSAIQEKLNDTRKKYKDMKVQFKETEAWLRARSLYLCL